MTKNEHPSLDRLKKSLNISKDSALAKIMGVNQSTLSTHRQRQTIPYEHIIKVCGEHDIDILWVMTGKKKPDKQKEIIQPKLSIKERAISRVVRVLNYLSPENIEKVMRYVEIAYERAKLEEEERKLEMSNAILKTGTDG